MTLAPPGHHGDFFGFGPKGGYLCNRKCCEALGGHPMQVVCVICGNERHPAGTFLNPMVSRTHGTCECLK